MIRTQVFLREDQRERAKRIAKSGGPSVSELVRIGLDWELNQLERQGEIKAALEQTKGALPDFRVLDRSEWDRTF